MTELTSNKLRTLTLSGTPGELGESHGKAFGEEITISVRKRMLLSQSWPDESGKTKTRDQVYALGQQCWAEHESDYPELLEEICALAKAVNVDPVELLIMNGYTDFRDLVFAAPPDDPGGCTAFMVTPEGCSDGRAWIGQTWDMDYTALPHVVFLEMAPKGLPRLKALSLTGCVGMIGMNECGIAIGITNLNARRGQPGIMWPLMVRKILATSTLPEALKILQSTKLVGGHDYILMGPEGKAYNYEYLPEGQSLTEVSGSYVHANHCLAEELQAGEYLTRPLGQTSTRNRQRQAEEFFASRKGKIDLESLQELTRIEEPGIPWSICARRSKEHGITVQTCGAVIMSPDSREMCALKGLPVDSEYQYFRF